MKPDNMPKPWKDKITPEQKEALEASLVRLNSDVFNERVDFKNFNQSEIVNNWLLSLGMVVAGTLSSSELAGKSLAYQRLFAIDMKDKYFPIELFSDENLLKAAKKFKFFPTYEEISSFLTGDEVVEGHRAIKWRVENWLQCKVEEPKQLIENQEVAAQIKELMAGMFKKVPEQQQIEVTL